MVALGCGAATLGSLTGLGGGFIVAPALRIFFNIAPDEAAATSLVLVLANAASASVAFLRQRRVDMRLALVVGISAIPTSIAGALAVHKTNSAFFDVLYAALLAVFAATLVRRSKPGAVRPAARLPWSRERTFIDRTGGTAYRYSESLPLESGTGLATGFLSSFFGIGGGTVVVPVLLRFFALPPQIVSGSSLMIILISAPFGLATHAFSGDILWRDAVPLALGGLAGGQAGALFSKRLTGPILERVLAAMLGAAALSLFLQHLGGMLRH